MGAGVPEYEGVSIGEVARRLDRDSEAIQKSFDGMRAQMREDIAQLRADLARMTAGFVTTEAYKLHHEALADRVADLEEAARTTREAQERRKLIVVGQVVAPIFVAFAVAWLVTHGVIAQ